MNSRILLYSFVFLSGFIFSKAQFEEKQILNVDEAFVLNTSFLENKRNLAKDYEIFFKEKGIKFRTETQGTKANYWLMCVELENLKERNLFLESTNSNNIMTRPIWKLMSKLPMFKDSQQGDLTYSKWLEDRVVNIPSSII